MCFSAEMAEKHMKALELQFIKETTDLFIDKKAEDWSCLSLACASFSCFSQRWEFYARH